MSIPSALLRLEALLLLVASVSLYRHLGGHWPLFALLVFVPDLSMLGYLAGPRPGSVMYDLAHTYVAPGILAFVAWLTGQPSGLLIALIWIAHIAFDRALGYGIKYPTGFRDTHLQRV